MPAYVSPGVYVIEKDISEYAPTINSSIIGLVGFAGKGPTNKATLITSPQRLVDTFGLPSEGLPGQALEGAIEVLETTNQVYFVRADTGGLDASTVVPVGCCPAVEVSNVSAGITGGKGTAHLEDASGMRLRVQVYDQDGNKQYDNPQVFDIPSGTVASSLGASAQGVALKSKIGGDLASDKLSVVLADDTGGKHYLVAPFAGSGAYMSVSSYHLKSGEWPGLENQGAGEQPDLPKARFLKPAFIQGKGTPGGEEHMGGPPSYTLSSLSVYGMQFTSPENASGLGYVVQSLHPGEGYILSTLADGSKVGNSVEVDPIGNENVRITINDDGVANEQFTAALTDHKGIFVEEVINIGETNTKSKFIKGFLASGDGTSTALTTFNTSKLQRFDSMFTGLGVANLHGASGSTESVAVSSGFVKLVGGSYGLVSGTNGTGTTAANNTALIGDATAEPKTGMQALDDDLLNISMAATPGFYDQNVQNNLVTLAEKTQNFLALVSPPQGIGNAQKAIEWSNGQDANGNRTAAINSSYAAIYYPHVKVFSVFDGKDRFYDPTIYAARQMAYTDNVSETWFAPAGFVRGKLSKPTEVEVKLNQGDRDAMYSGGNVVNPIVNFPQQGITIFGQRTSQRDPTALDRVNVRRLMILIRKQILASTRRFVFEPNDIMTWQRITNVLNPMLDDIKVRRGLKEFRVVCDETTNTAIRQDRNELWCKVLLKPTKTAEILIFELNLTNQSAKLGSL